MATKYANQYFCVQKHLSKCKLRQISIDVTASARAFNIASHNTVDGIPKNSVQDCAQAVSMATKHDQSTF